MDFLENQLFFAENKLPPRAHSWRTERLEVSPEEWLYELADCRIDLNGPWNFRWYPYVPSEDAPFFRIDFDDSDWETIQIPAIFECLGYGTPIYTNSTYPFPARPPKVMTPPENENFTVAAEPNPTGRCRRRFTVENPLTDECFHLYFGGVKSAFRVWLNGTYVGYSENSTNPAEFDVSSLVRSGENLLVIEVFKYCSGSYLEDQDCWRLSGVFRDVCLHRLQRRHFLDVNISANCGNGIIAAECAVAGCGEDAVVQMQVTGPDGDVWSIEGAPAEIISIAVPEVLFWSPEKAILYHVRLVLKNKEGIRDIRHFRTGFRTVKTENRQLYVNGKSIKIYGVNRHEWHPVSGNVMDMQSMLHDVRMIKSAHFNAVRNSHYTCDPRWYELCDRFGLFLCDEANLETHGVSYHKCILPGNDRTWYPAAFDRIERMVVCNRNHVSILIWSLGNEAGFGDFFMESAAWIRARDCRPIQYADMNAAADFDSRTYPPFPWLRAYLLDKAEFAGEQGEHTDARALSAVRGVKPFITNEYAHAMGNSTGNFGDYWDLFESEKMLVGGFVWEWCEHGFNPGGRRRSDAYGGDFGDFPNSGNFCCDGLVRADRTPNPAYYEVCHVQQPVAVVPDYGCGVFTVRSKRFFREMTCRMLSLLYCDGEFVQETEFIFSLAPGAGVLFPLPVAKGDGEFYCRQLFYEDGIQFAATEFPLDPSAKRPFNGPDVVLRSFDRLGLPGLTGTPHVVLDRALTDNDRGMNFGTRLPKHPKTELMIESEGAWRTIRIAYSNDEPDTEIARFGLRLEFSPGAVKHVEYYGRGPWENYCDRKRGAFVGKYRALPHTLRTDYSRPQENGQRSDVRTLALEMSTGETILISGGSLFQFTLLPYSHTELASAKHPDELPISSASELTLDCVQRGVGGDNSWGADVHDAYRIFGRSGEGVFYFRILGKTT